MHDGRNVECRRVLPDQDDDFADADGAREGHRNDAEERPLHQGPQSEADHLAEQKDVSVVFVSSINQSNRPTTTIGDYYTWKSSEIECHSGSPLDGLSSAAMCCCAPCC